MDHYCICCETRLTPIYHALCNRCHHKVPDRINATVADGYRHRVTNQVAYTEALLVLMEWRTEAYPLWHEKGIE